MYAEKKSMEEYVRSGREEERKLAEKRSAAQRQLHPKQSPVKFLENQSLVEYEDVRLEQFKNADYGWCQEELPCLSAFVKVKLVSSFSPVFLGRPSWRFRRAC